MTDRARRRLETATARAERRLRRAAGRRTAAQRADDAASAAREARRQRARSRAPIGFWGSPRFLVLLLGTGMVGAAWLVLRFFDVPALSPLPLWLVLGWLGVVAALYVDTVTWRARLPFRVEGYTVIDGVSPPDEGYAPWIALRVRIELKKPTPEAASQRGRTLDLLVGRVTQMLAEDTDVNPGPDQVWRRNGDEAVGQAGFPIYTARVIERWLRRDVRRLARAYPVDGVVVTARYTGSGYHVFSSSV